MKLYNSSLSNIDLCNNIDGVVELFLKHEHRRKCDVSYDSENIKYLNNDERINILEKKIKLLKKENNSLRRQIHTLRRRGIKS